MGRAEPTGLASPAVGGITGLEGLLPMDMHEDRLVPPVDALENRDPASATSREPVKVTASLECQLTAIQAQHLAEEIRVAAAAVPNGSCVQIGICGDPVWWRVSVGTIDAEW